MAYAVSLPNINLQSKRALLLLLNCLVSAEWGGVSLIWGEQQPSTPMCFPKKTKKTKQNPGIFSRLALLCWYKMKLYVQYEEKQRMPKAGEWREPRMKEWQRLLKSIYHTPRWSFFFLPHPGSQNRLCQWKKKCQCCLDIICGLCPLFYNVFWLFHLQLSPVSL